MSDDSIKYLSNVIRKHCINFSIYDNNLIDKKTWLNILNDINNFINQLKNKNYTKDINVDTLILINYYENIVFWIKEKLTTENYISVLGL
ncbi:hypothetical protein KHQ81_06955 [Mycoplasmatota bacterium]|nr:hypothetical protein KHQ81_06955 [Mycoplasmatota bacterium]